MTEPSERSLARARRCLSEWKPGDVKGQRTRILAAALDEARAEGRREGVERQREEDARLCASDYMQSAAERNEVWDASRFACATAIRARSNPSEPTYRCVQGHDLCATSYPGPDCPYCERVEPAEGCTNPDCVGGRVHVPGGSIIDCPFCRGDEDERPAEDVVSNVACPACGRPDGHEDWCAAPKLPADMTDPELNTAMAVEVMGWVKYAARHGDEWCAPDDNGLTGTVVRLVADWSPTTDIAAAMNDVVPAVRGGVWTVTIWQSHAIATVHVGDDTGTLYARSADAPTPTHAICEAALAAVRSGTSSRRA